MVVLRRMKTLRMVGKMSRRNSESVRVGRTITGEWEKQESESERLLARKREKAKKIIKILSLVAVLGIIATVIIVEFSIWAEKREESERQAVKIQPTVEIIDEGKVGITTRMKDYVAQIERDFRDLGYTVNRAVVPAGKSREIDVFLDGYEYYVKLNMDRGTAVSAEDAMRMIKYLSERDIHPEYVDVRVREKGYYK